MVVVIHVCDRDIDLGIKNLKWWKELDRSSQLKAIIAHDDQTPPSKLAVLKELAESYFSGVTTFWYPAPLKKSWPAAPNWAWQNCARYMAAVVGEPWLFLEADVVAIRSGWLRDIAKEYEKAGKPFMGHIVEKMGHLNGAAVYPANVALYSVDAFRTEEAAWDVVMGAELSLHTGGILANVHSADKLFQHCWCINPADGKCWNGSGEIPTFRHPRDVVRLVDLNFAVFHRCKDGSLIDQLRIYYADPSSAMVPQVQDGPVTEAPKVVSAPTPVIWEDKPLKYKGTCGILVVTHAKDFPWLEYAARGFTKFLHGFTEIVILLPHKDAEAASKLACREHPMLRFRFFDEAPGKGKLHQMVQECRAEEWCEESDIILHIDADCIFHTHTTPDDYITDDKPVMLRRSYAGLYDPVNKVISDCAQWQAVVEKTLKLKAEMYTMCRHPSAHPRWLYPEMRRWIEKKQGMSFEAYVLAGRNEFPQSFCEYGTLGAFAWGFHRHSYHWIDLDKEPPPADRQKTFWSHGGISDQIKAEIEGYLGIEAKPHYVATAEEEARMAQ